MNPIGANIIASAVPVGAGVLAGIWPRRSPKLAWLCFAMVCLLWASVVVPLPDGNPIGTRDEWFRRLGYVASLPFGIALGATTLAVMRRRTNAARRGFDVVPPDGGPAGAGSP